MKLSKITPLTIQKYLPHLSVPQVVKPWMRGLFLTLFILFSALILLLAIRGISGNPTSGVINDLKWTEDGPFELSPDRGRFALMLSMVENHSFHFSLPIAKFATPDLGFKNGNFVSLFAPAVSFIIVPGYIIGSLFGLGQVGAFIIIALFALANLWLIRAIAIDLGAHPVAATLGALVFLFATPAFTYAVTLYQHHISTFTVLLSLYLLLRTKKLWPLLLVWFLFAASIPIDYPNLFFMAPIALYALGRIIFTENTDEYIRIRLRFLGFLTFVGVLLPILFFFWFNQKSYGNPLQFSGTVSRVTKLNSDGTVAPDVDQTPDPTQELQPVKDKKSAIGFFRTRALLNGFYIHFVSPDRGVIVYTPIVLFGILGIFILYKQRRTILTVLIAIIGTNILLYSMWGDPWGGWAFGSRYLIPTYAILAILLSLALSHWKRNIVFVSLFLLVLIYSVSVNTLGAITSSRIPPQVEAVALEKLSAVHEKFSYDRDLDYLKNNRSKSFIFQTLAYKYVDAWHYYLMLTALISITGAGLLGYLAIFTKKNL